MNIDKNLLNQDMLWILDVDHEGYCGYGPDCDHDYNRCYRISGITISEPSAAAFKYLAETLVPAVTGDKELMAKVLKVCQEAHQKFDFTDTSNFDWEAEGDYYGDSLSYVRFLGSIQDYLAEELGKI